MSTHVSLVYVRNVGLSMPGCFESGVHTNVCFTLGLLNPGLTPAVSIRGMFILCICQKFSGYEF